MAYERGEEYAAELAKITDKSPAKARVLEQYEAVAGGFERLWQEIYARTEHAEWREDGIGSCHSSPHMFETYVGGVVSLQIERLWDAIAEDADPDSWRGDACIYHRPGHGCVLGSLKSPRCLGHVGLAHYEEIRDRLGIELPDMRTPLEAIQMGGLDLDESGCTLHPEVNDELVNRTVQETEVIISRVQQHPLLPQEPAA